MKSFKIVLLTALIFTLSGCSNITTNESEKKSVYQEEGKIERILIGDFKKELAKNNSNVIDLRTDSELKESGVIAGANQIDFYSSDFKEKLEALDKNKKYLIYCRSGARSGKTLSLMKDLGFTNVLELKGGISNWINSGEKTVEFTF